MFIGSRVDAETHEKQYGLTPSYLFGISIWFDKVPVHGTRFTESEVIPVSRSGPCCTVEEHQPDEEHLTNYGVGKGNSPCTLYIVQVTCSDGGWEKSYRKARSGSRDKPWQHFVRPKVTLVTL